MDDHHQGFRIAHGMRQGYRSERPLPTRLVSNEEFAPLPQTPAQRTVEQRILMDAGRLAPRLELRRRDFLRTSGGMACSLLAMNAVFGDRKSTRLNSSHGYTSYAVFCLKK